MTPSAVDKLIDAAPKVELHLHLVGSAAPATVAELAARTPEAGVPSSLAELEDWFEFRDFEHFIELYSKVNSLVRTAEDVATLVAGSARDLATQNVRYAEMTVTPYMHTMGGMPYGEVLEGLRLGRAEAAALGVEFAWIFDIPGQFGQEAARATLDCALDDPPEGLVGFGLAGAERGVDRSSFSWAFEQARAAGLRSVPHAGEADGPPSIWAALDELGAERIGHGVRAVEDPALVERLVAEQVPLEVCPSSNVCTRVFPDLASHSIGPLLVAGAFVTINSDDPPMFSTTLSEEYRRVAVAFGLEVDAVAGLLRNGVVASFLPGQPKAALLAEIDAALDGAMRPDPAGRDRA